MLNATCPKCDNDKTIKQYKAGTSAGKTGIPECLVWRCISCGYTWRTPCADATNDESVNVTEVGPIHPLMEARFGTA